MAAIQRNLGSQRAHIVVPMHKRINVGTLGEILKSVEPRCFTTSETLPEVL